MEIIIVLCLLIVIALLLQDKIVKNISSDVKPKPEKINPKLPDIMGQPKPVKSVSMPNTANESQLKEPEINPDDFDIEYDENETLHAQIPQEEVGEVFSSIPDLEEEEDEDRYRYGIADDNNGFAQGVTFEELSSLEMMLKKERLASHQKETAIAVVHKLQGTELFSLLENSVEDASRKIAELLDSKLSSEGETSSSYLLKNDISDFDIEEFV